MDALNRRRAVFEGDLPSSPDGLRQKKVAEWALNTGGDPAISELVRLDAQARRIWAEFRSRERV